LFDRFRIVADGATSGWLLLLAPGRSKQERFATDLRPLAWLWFVLAPVWNIRRSLVVMDDVIAETDRAILRPWRLGEADRFFDMHRRDEVARWIGGRPMGDRAEAIALLERMRQRHADDPRFGSWAVVERSTSRPCGSVLLKALPDGDGEIEIGWHLHPDSWGRGLATEAGGALLDYGLGLGLSEIWAVTHLDNSRSVRVCEKLGLRLLGITERWYHEPSLMFWTGVSADQQPSLPPDRDVPEVR
jgi:RimJ/RimL family protein N-acetyltransferase